MTFRVLPLVAAAAILAACSTAPEEDAGGAATGAPPTTEQPERVEQTGPAMGSVEQFAQQVGDRVYFAYDSSALDGEARANLQRQAAWLNNYPQYAVMVQGHADERGTREYNLALGERRANAARDYLVAQGVSPSRVSTVSYGEERPVCVQSNESCWSRNRRGVTELR